MKNNLYYNAYTQASNPQFPQEPLSGSDLGLKIERSTSATDVVLKRLRHYTFTENEEKFQPLPDKSSHAFGKERRKDDFPPERESHAKIRDAREYAKRMLADGIMPLETVSRLAGVNLATVKELAAQMAKNEKSRGYQTD